MVKPDKPYKAIYSTAQERCDLHAG